ncbi:X-linked retinitis pigmentosa GTPase regulator isoform X2 [Scyliorhinus canicula]|uniref:X-linked retinitis pigmentosa GTPase regulator isoform X2 n=1 Tax=Scyliorhinus canicula TaxID=7830 RepID=UPI0018F4C152|nr:X-linked retinitis pigmentosa GTPase regulator isoform X2 [Scyliorhinus canicula]
MAAEPESEGEEVPDSGAVFTFGKSKFSDNVPSKFWLKNDKAVSISCGDEHTAFITENGKLYIFGSNNWGQLGLGTKNTINKPTCVKALKSEKVKLVACGRNHTLVCTEQGTVYATGDNSEGQLGLGDTEERTTFQRIEFFTNKQKIKRLAAGSNISAALTVDGNLFMWGDNSEGQIGLDTENNANVPHQVDVGKPICWVSCGYYHSAFVTDDGQLYTVGESDHGKLGLPLDQPINHRIPQPVAGISGNVTQVSCGGDHTIVLAEGDVYAFGFGQFGQLGHGTFIFESSLPKVVEQLKKKNVQFISCGENHTAIVTDNGLLYTFGDGRHGKLGLGEENFTNQFKPTLCSRFLKLTVQSVACGGCHMLVLATPRPKDSENVVIEDDDINENYLTNNYSTALVDSSTPSTLRRALSARIRRREREMSPDKLSQLVRTLPPIGAGLLNSSLPISSQTIPGMKVAEENLIASKSINGVRIFEESPSPNKVPRVMNAHKSSGEEESEEENDKGLGDTTDFLNMTHTVIVNPNDKSLTLSPVHKEQRGECSGKGGQRKTKYNGQHEAKKPRKLPLQARSPRLNLHTSMLGAVGDAKHTRHSSRKAVSKEAKTTGKENLVAKLNQSAAPRHNHLYDNGTMTEEQNTVAIKVAQAHGTVVKQKTVNYFRKARIGKTLSKPFEEIIDLSHNDTSAKTEIPLKAINRKAKPTSMLSTKQYEKNIAKQSEETAAQGDKKVFMFNRKIKKGNNSGVNKHKSSGLDNSIQNVNSNKSLKRNKSIKHFRQDEHMNKETPKEQMETKFMLHEKQVQDDLERNLNAKMGKEITLQKNILKLGNKVVERTILELLEGSTDAEKNGKAIEADEDKEAVGDEEDVTLGNIDTIADDMSAEGNGGNIEESTTTDEEEAQESGDDGEEIDKGGYKIERDQGEDGESVIEAKEVIEMYHEGSNSNDEEGENSEDGDESNSTEARGNVEGKTKRNRINEDIESGSTGSGENEGNEDVFESEGSHAEENEMDYDDEGKSKIDGSEEDEGGKYEDDESEGKGEDDQSKEEEDGSDEEEGQSREDKEQKDESREDETEEEEGDEGEEEEGDEGEEEEGDEGEEEEGDEGEEEEDDEGEEEEGDEGEEEEGDEGEEEEGDAGEEEEGDAGEEEEDDAGEEEEGDAGEEEEGDAGEEEEGDAGEEEEGDAGEEEEGDAGEEEEGDAGEEEEGDAGEEEEGDAGEEEGDAGEEEGDAGEEEEGDAGEEEEGDAGEEEEGDAGEEEEGDAGEEEEGDAGEEEEGDAGEEEEGDEGEEEEGNAGEEEEGEGDEEETGEDDEEGDEEEGEGEDNEEGEGEDDEEGEGEDHEEGEGDKNVDGEGDDDEEGEGEDHEEGEGDKNVDGEGDDDEEGEGDKYEDREGDKDKGEEDDREDEEQSKSYNVAKNVKDRHEDGESWEDDEVDEEGESNEEVDGAGNTQDEDCESNMADDERRNPNTTANKIEGNDMFKEKWKMKAKTKHIVWQELSGAKEKVNEKHHSKMQKPNTQQFWNNVLPHYLTLK